MAKQTFTTGQVLTAAQMTSLQQTAMLGGAANARVASYVLVAGDAGNAVTMDNAGATTITVNSSLFAEGDIVTIINLGAGACTITAGTATVTTSGSLVLAQNQGGVLRFTSSSAAIFFQFATPASGDIEGVTAGTGISGGGTSGTVTITNSMATAIDAKGDLVAGTGADTFSRLAVGANNTVLIADSTTATGLKWGTAAAPKSYSLLGTGALTGATTVTVSGISNMDELFIVVGNASSVNALASFDVRINGDTASNYKNQISLYSTYTATYSAANYIQDFSTGRNRILGARMSNNAGSRVGGVIRISGCNTTGVKTYFSHMQGEANTSDSQNTVVTGGIYDSTSTVSSISLVSSTGNFDEGNFYVYGAA